MNLLAYAEIDIFGIVILLLFLQNQRRSGSFSLEEQLFSGILIVTIVEQLMDAGQWLLDGASFPGVYALQMFVYTAGYGVAPVITCLWALYCDLRVNMDERGLRRRAPLYFLPILLNTLLLIANFFHPLVFGINPAHIYHRESYFFVYMVIMYLYGFWSMLIVMRKALKTESTVERREFRYMALFVIPPIIGGAIQWLFYGVSIVWACCVVSIVLVYINVLSRQISTDALTGLNNRRKLNRYLDLKINSAEADASMFLMMIDADNFKTINDCYGHAAGDRALIAIAEILKSLSASRDCFLARMGGDEFVILARDNGDQTPATLTHAIEARVAEFNHKREQPFQLSLSIGWARFHPRDLNTADALLTAADQNMYKAKAGKKARQVRVRSVFKKR